MRNGVRVTIMEFLQTLDEPISTRLVLSPSRGSHLPRLFARSRFSRRNRVLSQARTKDHFIRGSITCARLAWARPNIGSIHEYFQENRGICSSPPRLLASSSASLKRSSLSG